uniref:DNA-directed RNA polymerase n=1 Tax=Oryza punctata TaxID=4537 RepID=A0A0E0LYU2_ORYPU
MGVDLRHSRIHSNTTVEIVSVFISRLILSPLRKGQADTVGIALQRALLGETEGPCITHAKFGSVPHEYSTIAGIEESVQEILLNLKEIVLRSNLYGVRNVSICVKGPRYITAQDIILPSSVEIVDTALPIANLTEPTDFRIKLRIKRDRGYHTEVRKNTQDGIFFSGGNGNAKYEILFLEIWTNGSLTPKEALYEASRNLIDLFFPFLHTEEEGTRFQESKNRTYNCLKRANIHTLLDLLTKMEEDIMRIDGFRMQDGK